MAGGAANGARVSNAEIFTEVRVLGGKVASVRQSLDENVVPRLAALEARHVSLESSVDALNIKFYGIITGGMLGALAMFGKLSGWF